MLLNAATEQCWDGKEQCKAVILEDMRKSRSLANR